MLNLKRIVAPKRVPSVQRMAAPTNTSGNVENISLNDLVDADNAIMESAKTEQYFAVNLILPSNDLPPIAEDPNAWTDGEKTMLAISLIGVAALVAIMLIARAKAKA